MLSQYLISNQSLQLDESFNIYSKILREDDIEIIASLKGKIGLNLISAGCPQGLAA